MIVLIVTANLAETKPFNFLIFKVFLPLGVILTKTVFYLIFLEKRCTSEADP